MNEFKKKRIEMELSIIDVVNDLKYPISTIEAIERDEYKILCHNRIYIIVLSLMELF